MTQTIWFSFPLFQRPCPFLSGLDFLKAGRELILQMELSVFSPLLFFIYLAIYTLPLGGREVAMPFLEVVTCSWVISYNIYYTHHWLVRSDFCFRWGVGMVTHRVSKTLYTISGLWFPGERTVLGPGLACFACMCILIRSFLMMSGLFVSYFQAISWRRTHSGSWQRGQNGSRVPEPKPCFILYGNSFIPFKYWISLNFYKNNTLKAKRI